MHTMTYSYHYTNLIVLARLCVVYKNDGIQYVPSPLSRGACFCALSFYYELARVPLVFVLFKSTGTCSADQGFYEVPIFGFMLLSEPETTSFLSSLGAFMLDRRASKVE